MKKSVSKIISTTKFDPAQQTPSIEIDTGTVVEENIIVGSGDTPSGDTPSLSKVYYIADKEGAIASYNPNYIVRQEYGKLPYQIFLPSTSGTLALTEDLETAKKNIYEQIYVLTDDVTDLEENYDILQTDVKTISGKVDGYVSIQTLRQALDEAVASDIPENGYTVDEVVKSYNKLLQSLRNLIKEN